MTWAAFLGAISGPLIRKILVSIGVGMVTFTGLNQVASTVSSSVGSALGGLTGSVYQVMALAGFIDACNYWLTAISAVVAWAAMARLGSVPAA